MTASILITLFSSFTFAQSFPQKPDVPVFNIDGQGQVIIDCWDQKSGSQFQRFYIPQSQHPSEFNTQQVIGSEQYAIQVNLLRSENTLTIEPVDSSKDLSVFTYGTELGYHRGKLQIYCSIFMGEINEN